MEFGARSRVCGMLCAVIAAVAAAACSRVAATPPPAPLAPPELHALVSGRTLRVRATAGAPVETLLFLAPDRTGWLDNAVVPGEAPMPAGMSMVFEWGTAPGSRVCVWATPLIGQMPSFVPPFEQCVQILRSGLPPQGFSAIVEHGEEGRAGPLELLPFNAFPAASTEQYLEQVRVLYGGKIPSWSHP